VICIKLSFICVGNVMPTLQEDTSQGCTICSTML